LNITPIDLHKCKKDHEKAVFYLMESFGKILISDEELQEMVLYRPNKFDKLRIF
jgi:hypothetical protein